MTVDGRALTFAEVNTRVNRLVSALGALGVGHGDRLAILAVDDIGYVETILAAMKLGATYVPLNYRLGVEEMTPLVGRAAPVVLVHSGRYADAAARLAERAPGIRAVVALDGEPVTNGLAYEALLASGDDVEPAAVGNDDDVLGLAFTSGTTSLPKGVLQSQRMIKHMVGNVSVDYRARADDVRYNAAPLFHISGMAMTLMGIAVGSTTVLVPQFDADTTLSLLAEDRLTACFMVPTMISSVLALPGIDEHAYERLELMMYGAAPMSPALLSRAMATFRCDFLNAFGAGTEAGLQTVLTPADHRRALDGHPHLLGSIGRPSTGVTLRLTDDSLRDVAPGDIGEITTRSDSVMDGYLDDAERTAGALREGWFRAGDLAWRDSEGYLYLAGRTDDMIIRGGENVHPVEIESVIADHPTVDEVAVVGAPDDHWGETVHAFVRARPGTTIDADVLRSHCRDRLAAYKVPVAFHEIDVFPLNASGKILRRELARRLAGADGAEPHHGIEEAT